jgi:hypothetical protein
MELTKLVGYSGNLSMDGEFDPPPPPPIFENRSYLLTDEVFVSETINREILR